MTILQDLKCRWTQIYGEPSPSSPEFNTLQSYLVDDIRLSGTHSGVVLLLESPHTAEIFHRYPLAGISGEDVTNALSCVFSIPQDYRHCPFGEILLGDLNTQVEHLNRIGVMNVSQLPMQSKIYSCSVRRSFDSLLKNLNTLRDSKAIDRENRCTTKRLKEILIYNLKSRIDSTPAETLFVPCGEIARAYFRVANRTSNRRCSNLCVPHPSRRQWKSTRSQQEVNTYCVV